MPRAKDLLLAQPVKGNYKAVGKFRKLPFADQEAVLQDLGVYVFETSAPPSPEAGQGDASDSSGDLVPVSDIGEGSPTEASGTTTEEEGSDHGLPPPEKRLRVTGKSVPNAPHLKATHGACIPTKCAPSRMSRELDTDVFSVNWRNLAQKPETLRLWNGTVADGLPPARSLKC